MALSSTEHGILGAMRCPACCGTIIVEQLNHAQWHAHVPGRGATGVGNYVETLAAGLDWGVIDRRTVETLALDGTRLVMALTGLATFDSGGVAWAR